VAGCLLWKRVPGCTIPMAPMHLPPMAPMNRVEQIRALACVGAVARTARCGSLTVSGAGYNVSWRATAPPSRSPCSPSRLLSSPARSRSLSLARREIP
jgi:hypothetical protein